MNPQSHPAGVAWIRGEFEGDTAAVGGGSPTSASHETIGEHGLGPLQGPSRESGAQIAGLRVEFADPEDKCIVGRGKALAFKASERLLPRHWQDRAQTLFPLRFSREQMIGPVTDFLIRAFPWFHPVRRESGRCSSSRTERHRRASE